MSDAFVYALADIPETGCKGLPDKGQPTAEVPFLAVRHQNQLHVYRNRCPHLGIALEWMPDQFLDREGHYIQCSTHGALFRRDNGLCISGPCQGESLETIPFRIEGKSLIIESSK
jgi:nitrite reductase/ring-hydroxylating ferredoxin subunit